MFWQMRPHFQMQLQGDISLGGVTSGFFEGNQVKGEIDFALPAISSKVMVCASTNVPRGCPYRDAGNAIGM
ncbi:hypothetical protein ACNKHR_11655 [Shigella flexneri]